MNEIEGEGVFTRKTIDNVMEMREVSIKEMGLILEKRKTLSHLKFKHPF
jgi:hypothetical protein